MTEPNDGPPTGVEVPSDDGAPIAADPRSAEGTPLDDETPIASDPPRPAYRDLPPVSERDLAARARGLSSAYIEGGEDPDLAETRRREALYRRLLIGMIVLIVGLGLIVTIVGLFVPGVG